MWPDSNPHLVHMCVLEEFSRKKPPESLTHQSCLSLKEQPASPLTALRHTALVTNHVQAGAFLENEGTRKLGGNTSFVLFCFFLPCSIQLVCPEDLPPPLSIAVKPRSQGGAVSCIFNVTFNHTSQNRVFKSPRFCCLQLNSSHKMSQSEKDNKHAPCSTA